MDKWSIELEHDCDKEYILAGLTDGFSLIDQDASTIESVAVKNHSNAIEPLRDKVEAQINEELTDGNYEVVDEKPRVVSALAAIEKTNGQVRLIHDLSRPARYDVNEYALKDTFHAISKLRN